MRLVTIISILLLLFTFSNVVNASTTVYRDVPVTHSNYEDIIYLLEKGVLEPKNTFGVNEIVTREEVAVMIAKSLGLNGSQRQTIFSDVPKSNQNSGYIQSAVEEGIIKGYEDGTFRPNLKVTRGHMAAFIARAFDLPNGSQTFKDVPKGGTAYEAVQQLVEAGITTGYEDATFKPDNSLTRGHISAFLARAIKYENVKTSKVSYEVDIESILRAGNSIRDYNKQQELLNTKKSSLDQLLKEEQRKLDLLLTEKESSELRAVEVRGKLEMVQSKLTAERTIISNLNQEIKDYRANNKALLVGSKAQKEKYLRELEVLQKQYAQVQEKASKLIEERTTINNNYTVVKNNLNRTRQDITNTQKNIAAQMTALSNIEVALRTVNSNLVAAEAKEKDSGNRPDKINTQYQQKPQELEIPYKEKDSSKDTTTENDISINQDINTNEKNYDVNLEELTEDERELARIINEYRKSLGLEPFRVSKSLTTVARSHVIDSNKYSPENGVDDRGIDCNLHSWSKNGPWTSVCYTGDHQYSQQMWDKPRELTNYLGNGYEISVYSSAGISPSTALKLWQNSPGHNNVIIGDGSWSDLTVMGIGINGNYAHVWFGKEPDNTIE